MRVVADLGRLGQIVVRFRLAISSGFVTGRAGAVGQPRGTRKRPPLGAVVHASGAYASATQASGRSECRSGERVSRNYRVRPAGLSPDRA